METATLMPTFWKWDLPSRFDCAKKKEQEEAAAWKAVCKIVDARDKRICRACGWHSQLDAIGLTVRGHRHHIVYRSAGVKDESSNIVTLCSSCHNEVHAHRLQIDGDADVKLQFWRFDGYGWHLGRREIAPGKIDKE